MKRNWHSLHPSSLSTKLWNLSNNIKESSTPSEQRTEQSADAAFQGVSFKCDFWQNGRYVSHQTTHPLYYKEHCFYLERKVQDSHHYNKVLITHRLIKIAIRVWMDFAFARLHFACPVCTPPWVVECRSSVERLLNSVTGPGCSAPRGTWILWQVLLKRSPVCGHLEEGKKPIQGSIASTHGTLVMHLRLSFPFLVREHCLILQFSGFSVNLRTHLDAGPLSARPNSSPVSRSSVYPDSLRSGCLATNNARLHIPWSVRLSQRHLRWHSMQRPLCTVGWLLRK